eukprot:GHVR01116588.1.p1 GENE.GHVR01116588.1~~GHVR01116588.1.p1  ORF type:complete len:227 (+),score=59.55 GHVR01116588.1:469-1149(+)
MINIGKNKSVLPEVSLGIGCVCLLFSWIMGVVTINYQKKTNIGVCCYCIDLRCGIVCISILNIILSSIHLFEYPRAQHLPIGCACLIISIVGIISAITKNTQVSITLHSLLILFYSLIISYPLIFIGIWGLLLRGGRYVNLLNSLGVINVINEIDIITRTGYIWIFVYIILFIFIYFPIYMYILTIVASYIQLTDMGLSVDNYLGIDDSILLKETRIHTHTHTHTH